MCVCVCVWGGGGGGAIARLVTFLVLTLTFQNNALIFKFLSLLNRCWTKHACFHDDKCLAFSIVVYSTSVKTSIILQRHRQYWVILQTLSRRRKLHSSRFQCSHRDEWSLCVGRRASSIPHSDFTIVSFLLAVYSPPGRPLEKKKELGLVFLLLSLSRWSPHWLATVSASPLLSLSRWSPHWLATVSVHFCLCLAGLHTDLPQVHVHSVLKRLTVRVVILTDGTTEWKHSQWLPTAPVKTAKIQVHISFHKGWTRILSWTRVLTHYSNFVSGFAVSELNVTVHVLVSAPFRPTSQLEGKGGGGAEVAWRVSDWSTSVGCWHCLHVLEDPDRLSPSRWVAVLFVCSLCVALAVFVSWTRGVYLKRNDAAAVCDGGAMLPDWMDRLDDGAEAEISLYIVTEEGLVGNPQALLLTQVLLLLVVVVEVLLLLRLPLLPVLWLPCRRGRRWCSVSASVATVTTAVAVLLMVMTGGGRLYSSVLRSRVDSLRFCRMWFYLNEWLSLFIVRFDYPP